MWSLSKVPFKYNSYKHPPPPISIRHTSGDQMINPAAVSRSIVGTFTIHSSPEIADLPCKTPLIKEYAIE